MKKTFCSAPSDAQIREAAYLLYVASGCVAGNDLEYGLKARTSLHRRNPSARRPASEVKEMECIRFPLNANALCLNTPNPFPLRSQRAG